MTELEKLIEATFEEAAELNSTLKQRVHVTWNVITRWVEINITEAYVMEVAVKYNMQERFDTIQENIKNKLENI